MKESLTQHIYNVFFSLHMEEVPFFVYDCKTDILPEWTDQILLTHDYLVCSELNKHTEKLKHFLGKEIFQLNNKVYWFEGGESININPLKMNIGEVIENLVDTPIDSLKTDTYLPNWLDDFIFDNLGAEYSPDFQRFDFNLNLTTEENLNYLGTYFPRSYAESFCIFDNIFQNRKYQNIILQKDALNILSVGCGSGGDLVGLLAIIEKYCPENIAINIWAIDGNQEALDLLEMIISKYQTQTNKQINLNVFSSVFNSIADIDLAQYKIDTVKFDFILSFKMICEIISTGKGNYNNSYYDFVLKFVPLLSKEGVCVLLDVTTKTKYTTFNPILLNRQINQALRELRDYRTLLPLPCNLYEEKCTMNCFCQKIFTVSHSKHSADKSKVAYRVIASKLLNNTIVQPNVEMQYFIQSDKAEICLQTTKYKTMADAYKLTL